MPRSCGDVGDAEAKEGAGGEHQGGAQGADLEEAGQAGRVEVAGALETGVNRVGCERANGDYGGIEKKEEDRIV